jgi:hypothetical protein
MRELALAGQPARPCSSAVSVWRSVRVACFYTPDSMPGTRLVTRPALALPPVPCLDCSDQVELVVRQEADLDREVYKTALQVCVCWHTARRPLPDAPCPTPPA